MQGAPRTALFAMQHLLHGGALLLHGQLARQHEAVRDAAGACGVRVRAWL